MNAAALALFCTLWWGFAPSESPASWFRGGFTAEEMLGHCRAEEKDPVKDFGRGVGDRCLVAAHDACDRHWTAAVGDYQHLGAELTLNAVEAKRLFAGARAHPADLAWFEQVPVDGV